MIDLPQGRYKSMTDAELCRLADSDEEAYAELVSRYVGMVRRLVHVYSYNISDIDDLVSEGIIGLMNAIKSYDSSRTVKGRSASFSTYAYTCIHNRIVSAIKKSSSIINREENILDAKLSENTSPESIVMDREDISRALSWVEKGLSGTEKSVFECYMQGMSYRDTADKLGLSVKSVDNAMLRVRRKLRSNLR